MNRLCSGKEFKTSQMSLIRKDFIYSSRVFIINFSSCGQREALTRVGKAGDLILVSRSFWGDTNKIIFVSLTSAIRRFVFIANFSHHLMESAGKSSSKSLIIPTVLNLNAIVHQGE